MFSRLSDNCPAGDGFSHPGAVDGSVVLDWAFFAAQTSGDRALQRELLGLFLDQVRERLPGLEAADRRGRIETAHLLKGSCQGIGAWAAAAAAQHFEDAPADADRLAALDAAFAAAETAIRAHLAAPL